VLERSEFIDHPQTRALAMRSEIDDPILGHTVQPGVSVAMNDTPGEIPGPAPMLESNGAAAPEALAEPHTESMGVSVRDLSRGPLTGTLVLDFCSYIAGSYGPMILAQMGADVIKIESTEGDSFRHFGFGFLGWNQGKRGLALDFTTPEGRDIVQRPVDHADIVVENLRPGRMNRYGFGHDALAARNPRIIYMSVNAFGNHGPDFDQPGFDPLLQARSGVMAAQGGRHGHPVYLTCAICDYGAAMLSAFGCVLALNARNRTGRGQFCETSLLQAAIAFQAGEFIFYNGRPDLEYGFTEYRGRSALSRCYRCRDGGWLYIDVFDAGAWDAVRRLSGSEVDWTAAAVESADGALAEYLADYFAKQERSEALDALRTAGVPAMRVHRFSDLFDDPQIIANELLLELSHPTWERLTQSGILAKFSATPGKIDRAAPLLGEHTEEILTRYLGYAPGRIAELRERKILRTP
jgi:crotonobetainyl-CoA:carnitine CoA-transferase CaiB-like acyl-CoA transferase